MTVPVILPPLTSSPFAVDGAAPAICTLPLIVAPEMRTWLVLVLLMLASPLATAADSRLKAFVARPPTVVTRDPRRIEWVPTKQA